MEWVVVVPSAWTQKAYRLLVDAECVPRPWHFEGRYGSRTHRYYIEDDDNDDDTDENDSKDNDVNNNKDDDGHNDAQPPATTTRENSSNSINIHRRRRRRKPYRMCIPIISAELVHSKLDERMISISILNDDDDENKEDDDENDEVEDDDNDGTTTTTVTTTITATAVEQQQQQAQPNVQVNDEPSIIIHNNNQERKKKQKTKSIQQQQQQYRYPELRQLFNLENNNTNNNNNNNNLNGNGIHHNATTTINEEDINNNNTNTVAVVKAEIMYKPYTPSNRQHEPPPLDATIHPEKRQPHQQQPQPGRTATTTTAAAAAAVPSIDTVIIPSIYNDSHNHNDTTQTTMIPQTLSTSSTSTTSSTTTTTTPTSATTKPPAFTYMELFAGIGGFGVALEALGGQCIFVSELQESCRHVYQTNFPHVRPDCIHGDIYAVQKEDLPTQQCDLLVAGFPCQPFSALGSQPGMECPKSGTLFTQIVRVLSIVQPTAFVLENVPGLINQFGDTAFATIVASLQDVGYTVTTEICNARCLTAQSRKRLYIVGLLNQQNRPENGTTPTPVTTDSSGGGMTDNNENENMAMVATVKTTSTATSFEFPYIPDLGLRARDVINYYYDPLAHNETALLRITDAQLERLNTEPYWKPAHLAWPNIVLDTIVSHYGKSVARGHSQLVPASASLSYNNPRRFTPRECASAMGFPMTYVIPPKQRVEQDDMAYIKELYGMFGNAVCPPIIAAIAGAVVSHCPTIAGYHLHDDWEEWGRTTAIRLAYAATLQQQDQPPLPHGGPTPLQSHYKS